jgi:lysophospholipid acyltransferase (LPLAT)-like uncharacterized protein
MKLRNPKLISVAAWIAARTIRGWIGSLRIPSAPITDVLDPRHPKSLRSCLYAFWHEALMLPAHVFGRPDIKCHVLISRHADGQLIAETAQRLGYKTIRGSSSRGGIEAMREIMRTEDSHVAITPDGPRGPRRVVQPGIVFLASRTGLPMIAVGVGYDRPWRAKSWDRFALPKPFHRAVYSFRGPIHVPRDAGREELEHYRQVFQNTMDGATRDAEALAEGHSINRAAA